MDRFWGWIKRGSLDQTWVASDMNIRLHLHATFTHTRICYTFTIGYQDGFDRQLIRCFTIRISKKGSETASK